MSARRSYLWAELVVLFAGLPLLFASPLVTLPAIPTLLAVFVVVLAVLLRDDAFPRRRFWNLAPNRSYLGKAVRRFVLFSPALLVLAVLVDPDRLFRLPLERPGRWAVVVTIYVTLSVYPQEVLFRGFFFHRYAALFRDTGHLIAANVLAFTFLHVVYANAIALVLSAVGGYLFATTYVRTRSVLVVSIEHLLYGVFLFTTGLGRYFI